MDTLPLERLDRCRPLRQGHARIAFRAPEGRFDIVRVGRLRQVMAGAQFDRLYRGRDAGKPCKHDNERIGIVRMQRLHTSQARSAPVSFRSTTA